MNSIANQFRRIFSEAGSDGKDFSSQEERLREAQAHLKKAADELTRTAEVLSDIIRSKAPPDRGGGLH